LDQYVYFKFLFHLNKIYEMQVCFNLLKGSKNVILMNECFKDCIIIVSFQNFWSEMNNNSYFASILRQVISFCTIEFTWKLFINNKDNKYKLFLHFVLDKAVFFKPCFVTSNRSNARWSQVKPYVIELGTVFLWLFMKDYQLFIFLLFSFYRCPTFLKILNIIIHRCILKPFV
jgi:hypothetical protein